MRLKKYEREADHAYSFGVFSTLELLKHQPGEVREVLLTTSAERNEGVQKIRSLCQALRIPIEVNDRLVERIAPKENTYAIGVFSKYNQSLESDVNHVVLVSPGDMGNLGTILRTLLGFGITSIGLVRPAVDLFDPRVIRASMGALFQLNIAYFETFENYAEAFPGQSFYPFMTKGDMPLPQARFQSPFTLIFGNESSGLPSAFHDIGTSVTIPHRDAIDSLNLSVAVSIAAYATMRDILSPK